MVNVSLKFIIMEKVKILVACHKKAEVYQNDVYTPIQVGKALHPELDLGFLNDNIGDNISNLNPYYSELTAEYWGWKNLNCEYIGLQHYRRYFDFVFTNDNVDNFFKDADIILAAPFFMGRTVFDHWSECFVPDDICIAMKLLEKMYPDDYAKGQLYLTNKFFYPCNMFLCRKTLLDEFASWEFAYLEELRKHVFMSKYSRDKRLLGYVAEGLLPMYFLNRDYKIKTMPIATMPVGGKRIKVGSLQQRLRAYLLKALKKRSITYGPNVLLWLKKDGILDENYKLIL